MSIKAVLFDLDATLLPMNQDEFLKTYFKLIATRMARYGYDPKEVVDGIWKGSYAMIKNDGKQTNEEVFWSAFAASIGEKVLADRYIFDEFYKEEFDDLKSLCGFNKDASCVVKNVKKAGLIPVLATNPMFPSLATEKRAQWAGLDINDFKFYTTYENIGYSKPNPEYYREIASRLNLDPKECLMVGNDAHDDMIASTLGMKVFLHTDCLINAKNADISQYPQGGFEQLDAYLRLQVPSYS